ncbi:hypothetical protein [Salipaludibacillus agaradhaerens]|uniref:hypothetical protein n=1 Tax=Salipaludibacillus agaradhaerens TaxID=76935 RepID=UPI002150C839|nr:hypothetical protein [Salipaludibacillus agaradhaerens]
MESVQLESETVWERTMTIVRKPKTLSESAKVDTALVPEWNNTREFEEVIEVLKGEILNIGRVEKQYTKTGALLKGDGDQILLQKGWL